MRTSEGRLGPSNFHHSKANENDDNETHYCYLHSTKRREGGREGGRERNVPGKEGCDKAISTAKHTEMTPISPITANSSPRNRRPGLSKKERTTRTSKEGGREGARDGVNDFLLVSWNLILLLHPPSLPPSLDTYLRQ